MNYRFDCDESFNSPSTVIYISSDSESDVSDEWWSEDEEIAELTARVETQMASPLLISGRCAQTDDLCQQLPPMGCGPSTSASVSVQQTPLLTQTMFEVERCYAPKKNRHPIELCRNLTPIPDSPMSPPIHERGLEVSQEVMTPTTTQTYPMAAHMRNPVPLDQLKALKFTDCMICGKSTDQIRKETIDNYISNTVKIGETEEQTKAMKEAFEAGMNMGTFIFIQTGVSQAAACDGNLYTIATSEERRTAPGTLPIN